jgi:hypothetical protein
MNWILRHPLWFILIIIGTFILLSSISVIIFSYPAINERFDLTSLSTRSIGESIYGYTAPIGALASALLLFFALLFQIRTLNQQQIAQNNQNLKNESDIIFSLFGQFTVELSNCYYSFYDNVKCENMYFTGLAAVNKFINLYCTTTFRTEKFGNFPSSAQIMILLDSLIILDKRIDNANISDENKKLFTDKLNSYYKNYLQFNLESLDRTFEQYPNGKDEMAVRVQQIVNEIKGTGSFSAFWNSDE